MWIPLMLSMWVTSSNSSSIAIKEFELFATKLFSHGSNADLVTSCNPCWTYSLTCLNNLKSNSMPTRISSPKWVFSSCSARCIWVRPHISFGAPFGYSRRANVTATLWLQGQIYRKEVRSGISLSYSPVIEVTISASSCFFSETNWLQGIPISSCQR